jgi:hypothetical protein
MIRIPVTPDNIWTLYVRIRQLRPEWFEASTGLAATDYLGFESWMNANISDWYEHETGYVFVARYGHRAEIHPMFFRLMDEDFLRDVLADLLKEHVRVECPIINPKGRSMRRMLRKLGFQMEGIMKSREACHDWKINKIVFLDVELWAIVKGRS